MLETEPRGKHLVGGRSYDGMDRTELIEALLEQQQRLADLEAVEDELVRMANEWQEKLARYRVLVEEINDIIYMVDTAQVVSYISPVITSVSGYEPVEIIGQPFIQFVHTEDVARVQAQFQENISGCQDLVQFRFRVLTKPGEVRWARTYSRPILMQDHVVGLRGVMTDVTQWVAMEEEQARLIAELQDAAEQVKTLKGLLPICASCKKVRDDQHRWLEIEEYVRIYSDARLSHDLCPDCASRLYPGVFVDKDRTP